MICHEEVGFDIIASIVSIKTVKKSARMDGLISENAKWSTWSDCTTSGVLPGDHPLVAVDGPTT